MAPETPQSTSNPASSAPASQRFLGAPEPADADVVDEDLGGGEPPAVNFGRGGMDREDTDMDMTPMVDVTFLLLIFFMVTAAFSLQKSIEVPAPKDNSPSTRAVPEEEEEDPSEVTVVVDEYNTFRVLTSEEDVECPSEQELLMRLRMASQVATKMLVKANGEAELQYVVTALDAGTAVGMEQVQLMVTEEIE
jgi:biopolymer transport protein ExbD